MNEQLKKELEDAVIGAIGNINMYDTGSDERKASINEACQLLDKLNAAERDSLEYWDKKEHRLLEQKKNEQYENIEISKIKIEKEKLQQRWTEMDNSNKIEREKLDAKVSENAISQEIELRKDDILHRAIEIGKVVIPVVVPLIAYNVYQKRVLKFEETGRINSTAGRELHLPKIFNR